jgi:peptidylprolyl isomerase
MWRSHFGQLGIIVCCLMLSSAGPVTAQAPADALECLSIGISVRDVEQHLTVTDSGLAYLDLLVGRGPAAADGDTVVVHYAGYLAATCEKFDSSYDRDAPFRFTLGRGEVIAGFDEGIASMQAGGHRRLLIPPELGYGATGVGPIPPNASLIFDVELIQIAPRGRR